MVMIVSFVVLIAVLFIILIFSFNKILNRDVGQATAHLDQLAAEYAKREQEIKKQYDEIKREGQELLEFAQKEADQQKQRILKEVDAEKGKIIAGAQSKAEEMIQQADKARNALLEDMDNKIEEKALERAQQLLQEAIPEHVRRSLHAHWVEDLLASSFQQLDRLHIPQGSAEVSVVTAFALTDSERQALNAKLREKLVFEVTCKEEVDPAIIAGWVVSIGSLVLDGSLRFKIQEAVIAKQKLAA